MRAIRQVAWAFLAVAVSARACGGSGNPRLIVKGYAEAGRQRDAGVAKEMCASALEEARELGDAGLEGFASLALKERANATHLAAVEILGRVWGAKAADALAEVALADDATENRLAAATYLKETVGKTPEPVLAALEKGNDTRLERACAAIERIRDRDGVGRLITIYVTKTQNLGGGDSNRGHITVVNEKSYIKDVQAQVGTGAVPGQPSSALDPEIGAVRSGTSFEAKATSIRILRDTIFRISGNAFRSADEMRAWWEAHKAEF